MFRNYLTVALRSLRKNRVSTLVNIIGLAIGMAAFVLIIQYVRYELSYDRFHQNSDRIYRIQQDRYNKGLITTQWAAGCSAVGQALYENFNECDYCLCADCVPAGFLHEEPGPGGGYRECPGTAGTQRQ